MKTRILNFLGVLLAALTVIGALDLANLISLLPEKVAAGFALIPPSIATIVHLINTIGDVIDDGKVNGSWLPKLWAFALIGSLTCLLPSCAGLGAAISGTPVPTTPIKRVEGGVPFELATSDVLKAEQDAITAQQLGIPPKAWGTYDAGLVAQKAREVIDSGK